MTIFGAQINARRAICRVIALDGGAEAPLFIVGSMNQFFMVIIDEYAFKSKMLPHKGIYCLLNFGHIRRSLYLDNGIIRFNYYFFKPRRTRRTQSLFFLCALCDY
jgi:hypothetical protein